MGYIIAFCGGFLMGFIVATIMVVSSRTSKSQSQEEYHCEPKEKKEDKLESKRINDNE